MVSWLRAALAALIDSTIAPTATIHGAKILLTRSPQTTAAAALVSRLEEPMRLRDLFFDLYVQRVTNQTVARADRNHESDSAEVWSGRPVRLCKVIRRRYIYICVGMDAG